MFAKYDQNYGIMLVLLHPYILLYFLCYIILDIFIVNATSKAHIHDFFFWFVCFALELVYFCNFFFKCHCFSA